MVVSDDRQRSIKLNRSVHRVAQLLKTLASKRQGMTLTELSAACQLPESTVYRLLSTLEREGFVERATDGTGRFQMGLEMFRGARSSTGSASVNRC